RSCLRRFSSSSRAARSLSAALPRSSLAFGRLFSSRAPAAFSSSGTALRTWSDPGAFGAFGGGGPGDGLPPDGFGWPDGLPPDGEPAPLPALAWASLLAPMAAPFSSPLLSSLLRVSAGLSLLSPVIGSFFSPLPFDPEPAPSFGGLLVPSEALPAIGPLLGLLSAPSPCAGSPFSRSDAFASLVSSLFSPALSSPGLPSPFSPAFGSPSPDLGLV